MGNYTLVIHGTGQHHNKKQVGDVMVGHPADADTLLEKFVGELKENGHVVELATITHGGRESVIAE